MSYSKRILALVTVVAFALNPAGCTTDTNSEAEAEVGEGVNYSPQGSPVAPVTDPEDVPEDKTDYRVDAGNDVQEYQYPDDPVPADSTVGTLCNLNQDYLSGLRQVVDGKPVVDDMLPTALVGFSDLLIEWDMLRPHFPGNVENIDRAHEIYKMWDEALLSSENGDLDAAQTSMVEAEELLRQLPMSAEADCF